jgi:hypothetical protein
MAELNSTQPTLRSPANRKYSTVQRFSQIWFATELGYRPKGTTLNPVGIPVGQAGTLL